MKKLLLTLLLNLAIALPVFADSPLTSTNFYEAYTDIPEVVTAHKNGVLDITLSEFLADKKITIDKKIAVINALNWKFEGKTNSNMFSYHLCLFKNIRVVDFSLDTLNSNELLLLAYVTAMDDYFNPEQALPILEKAFEKDHKNQQSTTYQAVKTLIESQCLINKPNQWNEIWEKMKTLLENKELNNDMRAKALEIIKEYLILYKKN